MKLYHGSTAIIDSPSVSLCRENTDFGKGFYITKSYKEAKIWAMRRAEAAKSTTIVNTYEFDYASAKSLCGDRFKELESDIEIFEEFVSSCHAGETHDYAVVAGPQVPTNCVLSIKNFDPDSNYGMWHASLKGKLICIAEQQVIDKHLRFTSSQQIDERLNINKRYREFDIHYYRRLHLISGAVYFLTHIIHNLERAQYIFFTSDTYRRIYNQNDFLEYVSPIYILTEFINELEAKGKSDLLRPDNKPPKIYTHR